VGLNGDRVMRREMPMDSLGSDVIVVIGPEMHMFGRQQGEGDHAQHGQARHCTKAALHHHAQYIGRTPAYLP